MNIKPKVINTWKILREHGDVEKIHQMSISMDKKISKVTIGSVFRTSRCCENTFEVMSTFYNEKMAKREALMKKTKVIIEEDGN